ncbi:probable E3 ubiquitin-protein ligase RNF144A-A [Ptychodera flava]|uniref:probable E3 ubiquitin-protein ligase RNF144A-A n=1 Tax=Ptychodera flava TaxID=63121 RepID=UPI00396A513C
MYAVEMQPKRNQFTVPTCGLHFCSLCKSKWHSNKTCDEFSKDSEASGGSTSYHTRTNAIGIPFSSDENAPIKRCPLCHVPIERDEGCAQMMCKRCKHVFCWYCLASLDDDFLLRHYDKGPCRDKLGHSRASVIWHRTQVVGIFAGFGVLLLVASPFLFSSPPHLVSCAVNAKCVDAVTMMTMEFLDCRHDDEKSSLQVHHKLQPIVLSQHASL